VTTKNSVKTLLLISLCVIALWCGGWALITFNIKDWDKRGTFGDMFGAVNSLFSALAFVGVVYSINLQIKSIKIDHDRRRKQATLEYLNAIRPRYKSLFQDYEKVMGPDVLTKAGLETILSNNELRSMIKDYLSMLEHLSVGTNVGVFDKDLIYRISAQNLIGKYYKFKPYIDFAQKTLPTAYIEYENLVKEFENQKKLKPSIKGNLD
jgi:hypothetical protein